MHDPDDPQKLLPLTPLTLQVLVTLANEPLHGYAAPHTVQCGPDGIFVNALGSPDGGGPGGIFVLDPESFEIRSAW